MYENTVKSHKIDAVLHFYRSISAGQVGVFARPILALGLMFDTPSVAPYLLLHTPNIIILSLCFCSHHHQCDKTDKRN